MGTGVNGSSCVKYVGSPYQTSLAEERQDKYFCMLERLEIDGKVHWKEVEQWSIDLQHARRHFKVNLYREISSA